MLSLRLAGNFKPKGITMKNDATIKCQRIQNSKTRTCTFTLLESLHEYFAMKRHKENGTPLPPVHMWRAVNQHGTEYTINICNGKVHAHRLSRVKNKYNGNTSRRFTQVIWELL